MSRVLLISALTLVFMDATAGVNDHSKGCKDSDIDGNWVGYQVQVRGTDGHTAHTGVCSFSVLNGEISQGVCNLSLFDAEGNLITRTGSFVGTAAVEQDCSATLTFDFSPRPTVSAYEIRLALDKKTYAGRWQNNLGDLGTTNGVKEPMQHPPFR